MLVVVRAVSDSDFPNPAGAGFMNSNPAGAGAEPDLRINVKQHQSQNESNESLNIKWWIQMSYVQEMAVVL